ncbi:DUF87 domain-containing protein [Actinokineospora sp. NBRC 105648]|uniref:type IV secretory system conjugative DNA transfer family protein n=1 Tax=Actinokineospora sp. NBRC 105648 TaxID=3032206 RepID=UPI0025538C0F|nr:DUF87 domain-containing protein [Actinokineospora sp. NBRC 105648]
MTSPIGDYLRDPWGTVQTVLDHLKGWAITWGPIVGPTVVLLGAALLAVGRWWSRRCHAELHRGARVITVLAPPSVDPDGAAAVWANLVGLLRPRWARRVTGQPHVTWEYVFSADGVRIQLWVPGTVPPGMVERAVEAAWPGAHTSLGAAVALLPASIAGERQVESVGGELRLARSEALPLRSDFPTDPIRGLLGAPVGLHPHERAVVQILARPVTGSRVRKARRAARRVRAGKSVHVVGRLLDLLTPHTPPWRRTGARVVLDHQTQLEASAQDRVIVAKHRGPQYETLVRYAVTAEITPPEDPGPVRDHLRGRGHAIASAFAAYSEHNYYRRARLRHPARALTDRRLRRGDLLSIPELAALAHLPTDEAVPGLQRAGAKAVPPPSGVPTAGDQIRPLGITDSGHPRPVGLRVPDARHHLHILGATGSGKSELMARMILADAEMGRGVVVVDPKGDLVSDILTRLPEHLGEKVVLFDADSKARPPILNPLEGPDTDRVVDNLVGIFSRVYESAWGPRTDDIFRAGLLTLRAQPGVPTLIDLPKLLTVSAFRDRAMAHVHDEVLRGFWRWYEELSDSHRAHVVAPLMNKLRGFLLRPFVRTAIAGGTSTVDMNTVLDGGICLVRIARDALGMDTARLIGSIVVARTWQAASGRARLPQRDRRDCSLYVDECHNFLTMPTPLEDMLAESRGYRLSITLAHQYLAQLTKELEEGISTNARSKVIFSASPEDAKRLARHTQPRVSDHDLAHLGVFHAAVRLVVNGEEAQPFTIKTEKLPLAVPGRAKRIRIAARINTQPPAPSQADSPRTQPSADPRRAA